MAERLKDGKWIRGSFGLAPMARDRRNLSLPKTSADYKFGDTTLGGNQAINPAPQFCRFADVKAGGLLANVDLRKSAQMDISSSFENEGNAGSYRLGRVYSEIHDDNAQYVHLRFGVPKFTGSIAFFANMYDRDAAILARTGDYTSIMRTAGRVAGLAAMFTFIPLGVIVPLILTANVLGFALQKKPSRYYYLKPAMNLYLQAVQAMADTQLLHHQLVPMWEPFNIDRYQEAGESEENKIDIAQAHASLPDIWKSNGKFDVYKAVNRYQVLANYQARTIEALYSEANSEEEFNAAMEAYLEKARRTAILKEQINDNAMSLENLARAYAENPSYQLDEEEEKAKAAAWDAIKSKYANNQGVSGDAISDEQLRASLASASASGDGKVDPDQTNETFWGSLFDFGENVSEQLASELKDGGQWVTFRYDGKEPVTDNFSNSFKEPEIASTLNSLSAKARTIDFSTSGGKSGFDLVDSAVKGIKDFVGGALDVVHLSGLAAIYGSSYTDIPEVWEAAQASVATQTFTIPLRLIYGNDFSRFQDLTLPILFLLAGVLPLSTGKQTYNSPLLCEMYCRGRQNIRLGMIESVSITRGVGNMGWRADGKMLGADVTFTVKDLSKVMTMPIIRDPGIFDDDNMYTDYMATIGGASLHQMTYAMEKMVFNLNKWKQSWKSAFMAGRVTNTIANTMPVRAISAFTSGTAK